MPSFALKNRVPSISVRFETETFLLSRLLALHLEGHGRLPEAERLFREALDELRAVLPPDNWEIGRTAAGAFADAERQLLDGYRIVQADRQALRATAAARERLVRLYEAWGRPEAAARWRAAAPC
jgi:hypothetical protein